MSNDTQQSGLVQDVNRSRQERAQAFAAYLKGLVIDYQYKKREWITSATELGRMLGVSDVTANDWLKGKTLPRREQCLRIAHTFGVSYVDVLEAAGYPVTQDDGYNTYATILSAVETDTTWPEEKRRRVQAALIEALSPEFTADTSASEWHELATLVLQQRSPALSKAEKIAGIIDLWHREDPRHATR